VQKCVGKGKHHKCKRVAPKSYRLPITSLVRKHLQSRAAITVEISQPARVGRAYLFTMRTGKQPTHRITCLALGSTTAGKDCA
jgi:hypothetical protein